MIINVILAHSQGLQYHNSETQNGALVCMGGQNKAENVNLFMQTTVYCMFLKTENMPELPGSIRHTSGSNFVEQKSKNKRKQE